MAVTKLTGLGEVTTNFLLADFTVYIMNTSATGGYVSTDWAVLGYTLPEKTITRNNEQFTREAKIPRVPIYQKTIRKNLEMGFSLQNVNENLIAMFTDGTKISLGATGTQISHGTTEANQEYRALRFVAQLENNKYYSITIPKAETFINGEQTVGGEENVVYPLMSRSFHNPSANATGDLYIEHVWASNISPTADTPPGYN